jgi:hypothetical protein
MVCLAPTETAGRPYTAAAPIVQIMTGHAITVSTSILCDGCGDPLGVGDIIFIEALRPVDRARWLIEHGYCWGCAPPEIGTRKLGVPQALLGGRLGTRSDPTGRVEQLCLSELALRRYSPPDDG